MKGKALGKRGLRWWMNFYHDEWIKAHNKLVEIAEVIKKK